MTLNCQDINIITSPKVEHRCVNETHIIIFLRHWYFFEIFLKYCNIFSTIPGHWKHLVLKMLMHLTVNSSPQGNILCFKRHRSEHFNFLTLRPLFWIHHIQMVQVFCFNNDKNLLIFTIETFKLFFPSWFYLWVNSGKIFADIFSRNKAATLLFTCGFFHHEFQVATFPYVISKMAQLWIDKDISSFEPDNIENNWK